MKNVLIFLLLLAWAGAAQAEEDFILYTVTATDTIPDLAEKHLGHRSFALELLAYNEISNPARVTPGTELFIPKAIRRKALTSFDEAQDWMVKAANAEAEKYARANFIDARGQLEKARNARNKAIYDQTIALSGLATRKAMDAFKVANVKAWEAQGPRINSVHGKVFLKSQPTALWEAAKVRTVLPMHASIKTEKASRAEIEFRDKSTIQILENTEMEVLNCLVDRRNGVRKTRLKVLMGNILGEITPHPDDDSEFEIDTGRASIAIRGTGLRVGAEWVKGGVVSLVSLLHGKTDVRAANRVIVLDPNTGTFSKNGAPPAPPIPLPNAPLAQTPAADAIIANQRPLLQWDPTKGPAAVSWRVEIARDIKFNQLVEASLVAKTRHRPGVLAPGDYFWRASGVEKNGLEGQSFAPRSFTIRKNMQLKPVIPAPAIRKVDRAIHRKGVKVSAEPAQADTSIKHIEAQVNGEAFKRLDAPLRFNKSGDYEVLFRGVAGDGSISPTETIVFTVDADAPKIVHAVTEAKNPQEAATTQIIALSASDLSGIETLEYRIDRQAFKPYADPVKIKLWADTTFEYRATDKLGNSASETLRFKGVQIGQ